MLPFQIISKCAPWTIELTGRGVISPQHKLPGERTEQYRNPDNPSCLIALPN